MPAERDADALGLAEREIVALAHVVEAVELHHHVVDHVDAALDEGDAVMAQIDVEEIGRERAQPIVAHLELEDVLIERHHLADALEMHHHVAHAERTGAEAGTVAAGVERLAGGFRAVEDCEPVAGGIIEHDLVLDVALAGERARAARNVPAASMRAATALSAAASATSQPKKPMPCPPSASTTRRCLRSSMRKARLERLLSMRCRPRKFSP